MDYRYYDQGRDMLPRWIRRRLHYLKAASLVFFAVGIVVPFLELIQAIQKSYAINLIATVCLFLGPVCYVVGLAFDGTVDRM